MNHIETLIGNLGWKFSAYHGTWHHEIIGVAGSPKEALSMSEAATGAFWK